MKLFSKLIIPLFLIANLFKAQINKITPQWVNIKEIKNIGSVNKKQIKDGYYYIIVDEQYNTTKNHKYFHYATTALTEEALVNVSQIEFSYDPAYEKVFLHFVKIHRGNEIIDKTSTLELKELNEENERNNGILSGKKTLYCNLSDIRKNDIVEYSYSKIGKNPIMKDYFNFDLWLSYSVPVGKINMRVIFDKNTVPSIINNNTSIKPLIKTTNVNDFIWEINTPKITTVELSTPSWYNLYQRVQISNLKDWKQVKEHCKSLLNIPGYNKASLTKVVDSITNSTQNKENQITSIIEFVQTHIRYSGNENGIYSHVPRTPDFVLKNRFGDCKEKSTVLNEMLKLIGIEAYPVLINTSLGKKIIEENPSITVFDHTISNFIYEGKNYFVDPTISYQRGNFKLRNVPSYEIGLILNNKPTTFEVIPIDLNSKTKILEEFFIDAAGDARLKVTSVCTGSSADDNRYYFSLNSIYDVQNSYKKFYTKYTDNIVVIDTVSFIDDVINNEFTVTEHYMLPKFWTIKDSSKSTTISQDFIPYSLNYRLNYGDEAKRNDPLKINFPVNHSQTITINKAGGWNVENETHKEDNRFFTYSFSTKLDGEKLDLIYNYVSKTNLIEPKDYLEFKEKMDFINNNMIFGSQEKPQLDGMIGLNWPLLLTIIAGSVLAAILIWYLHRRPYQSIYDSRYSKIGGWLVIVGIGITLNPFTLLYGIYNSCEGEMGVNYAVFFFDEKSSYFSPLKGYYTLFTTLMNTLMFGFSIFIAILFYQKKATFRLYYTFFRIFNSAILIINVIILHGFYGDSTSPDERAQLSKETTGMIKVVLQSLIWIPYIWISERSKYTFTNSTNSKETQVDVPVKEENNFS